MNSGPEQDYRVMTILGALIKLPASERSGYLQLACQGDEELRHTVTDALAWEERMGDFLKNPLISLQHVEHRFKPGEVIADRFDVIREIGEGGMGVVYEAFDQKRNQRIAIKAGKLGFRRLLSPELESALKVRHPNICLVNEIHTAVTDHGEVDFLTMEFLDGQALSSWLSTGGNLDAKEALAIARQLCAGLAEAHRSRVVHRDLKSANVLLCRSADGTLRSVITDFGLAGEPTLDSGDLAGTPRYMAPELWLGTKPSPASDIYALGVILYEMVTGGTPFVDGGSESCLTSRLTTRPPPPSARRKTLDPRWDRTILQCLDPSPAMRPPATQVLSVFDKRPVWKSTVLAIAALALVLGLTVGELRQRFFRPLRREPSFPGWNMKRITSVGNCYDAVISPNGQFVAYVRDDSGAQSLWLRQIATASDSLLIPSAGAQYWGLTFSPDGEYIYYVASQDSTGAGRQDASLYRIPLIGGPGVKLKENLDSAISFSPDGTQYAFVREYTSQHESALMVASLAGASERKLASSQLPDYLDFPSWSPDGKTIACTSVSLRQPSRIMFYGADGTGEKQQPISSSDWTHIRKIEWTKDGTGLLMAVKSRQATGYQLWGLSYPQGEVRRVTNDLNSYVRLSATANSHTLVTIQETAFASIWLAPNGDTASARQLTPDSGYYNGLSWTADGRILYAAETPKGSNIWIMDSDGKNRKQLTQGNLFRHHPAASPDGQYFFFVSCQNKDCDIWRMDGDGAHLKQLTNGSHVGDLQCTPDGKWIIYTSLGADKWATLWRISVDGGNALQFSKNRVRLAAVSPNGKWIASFSLADQADTQTEQPTLEIIPFDGGPPLRTFKVSPTVNYLAGLRWIRHGGAVTYVDNRGAFSNVWSQPIDGGAPTQLTDFKGDKLFEFAWSHDGSRLVYVRGIDISDVVLMTDFE